MRYERPWMEVMELVTEDIVCASGLVDGGKGDNDDKGGWTETPQI